MFSPIDALPEYLTNGGTLCTNSGRVRGSPHASYCRVLSGARAAPGRAPERRICNRANAAASQSMRCDNPDSKAQVNHIVVTDGGMGKNM